MMPVLLAVPNISEGRHAESIEAVDTAFSGGTTLLDFHSDSDHNRTVFTLAGRPGPLRSALGAGAAVAAKWIDMSRYEGAHPAIGALDVCPIVWLDPAQRDAARAEALALAETIGALGVPVFLYGELATDPKRAERAYFRKGGLSQLSLRLPFELKPDYGPGHTHPRAGATLVTARPPLAAFNVELDGGDAEIAREVAAGLRESGGGLPGVRAMGLTLSSGRAQVSTNVHDPLAVPLAEIVERVRELAAPLGARPLEAELVGLIPAGAMPGYPEDVPIRGFDPERHVIERRLEALGGTGAEA